MALPTVITVNGAQLYSTDAEQMDMSTTNEHAGKSVMTVIKTKGRVQGRKPGQFEVPSSAEYWYPKSKISMGLEQNKFKGKEIIREVLKTNLITNYVGRPSV